jgi:hypothetical protein
LETARRGNRLARNWRADRRRAVNRCTTGPDIVNNGGDRGLVVTVVTTVIGTGSITVTIQGQGQGVGHVLQGEVCFHTREVGFSGEPITACLQTGR